MGNTAIITGASRGIGRATALKFAMEGWNLALCCRESTDKLTEVAEEVLARGGAPPLCFQGDMGDADETGRFVELTLEHFPCPNLLVNNAGISGFGLLTETYPKQWREIMSSNLDSVYNCCHAFIPAMLRGGGGRIINISSVWGCKGASCEAAYSASKGGINALTQALARELAPSGIAVNALAFGAVDTEMNSGLSPEERSVLCEEIPAGRFASPEEAAEMIYLLAHAPLYLTGQIIPFDGGWI